jgi:putative chitinase
MITAANLVAAGIPAAQAQTFEAPLQATCVRFGIDTPARMAAFVAQCAHESRNFTALEEGLFYRSADRIRAIFPSRVPSLAVAQPLVGNPQALANCVYAGRNGNGDEASGDGFRYRGRGLIQLTGRSNYERAADALARDYVATPDLVAAAEDACLTAGWFWDTGNLNALADAGRFDAITRAVNGPAMAGADERRELFERALTAFAPEPAPETPEPAPATRGASMPEPGPAAQPAAKKKAAPSAKPVTAPQAAAKKVAAKKKAAATKTRAAPKKAGSASKRGASTKKAATKKRVTATKRPVASKRATPSRRATVSKRPASSMRSATSKRTASAKPAAAAKRAAPSRKPNPRKPTTTAAKSRAPAAKRRSAKSVRA